MDFVRTVSQSEQMGGCGEGGGLKPILEWAAKALRLINYILFWKALSRNDEAKFCFKNDPFWAFLWCVQNYDCSNNMVKP